MQASDLSFECRLSGSYSEIRMKSMLWLLFLVESRGNPECKQLQTMSLPVWNRDCFSFSIRIPGCLLYGALGRGWSGKGLRDALKRSDTCQSIGSNRRVWNQFGGQ